MSDKTFMEMLEARWKVESFVCVGLDSEDDKLPASVRPDGVPVKDAMATFNRCLVDFTCGVAAAFKLNGGFYLGSARMEALERTCAHIRERAPDVPIIIDMKMGDIGNSSKAYAKFLFDECKVHGATVNPLMGSDALEPFLSRAGKGIFVLCKTSNDGSDEFMNLKVGDEPLYRVIARRVSQFWNSHGNCGLVVGANYPEELSGIRLTAPNLPILMPGLGAQQKKKDKGAKKSEEEIEREAMKAIKAGLTAKKLGLLVNSSREIIFADGGPDYYKTARLRAIKLNELIKRGIEAA